MNKPEKFFDSFEEEYEYHNERLPFFMENKIFINPTWRSFLNNMSGSGVFALMKCSWETQAEIQFRNIQNDLSTLLRAAIDPYGFSCIEIENVTKILSKGSGELSLYKSIYSDYSFNLEINPKEISKLYNELNSGYRKELLEDRAKEYIDDLYKESNSLLSKGEDVRVGHFGHQAESLPNFYEYFSENMKNSIIIQTLVWYRQLLIDIKQDGVNSFSTRAKPFKEKLIPNGKGFTILNEEAFNRFFNAIKYKGYIHPYSLDRIQSAIVLAENKIQWNKSAHLLVYTVQKLIDFKVIETSGDTTQSISNVFSISKTKNNQPIVNTLEPKSIAGFISKIRKEEFPSGTLEIDSYVQRITGKVDIQKLLQLNFVKNSKSIDDLLSHLSGVQELKAVFDHVAGCENVEAVYKKLGIS